jgi:hypothetical protein
LAFLAVEVEVVDIGQERFGAFSVGLGAREEVRVGGLTAILRVLRAIGTLLDRVDWRILECERLVGLSKCRSRGVAG